jgi:hypothetical protein
MAAKEAVEALATGGCPACNPQVRLLKNRSTSAFTVPTQVRELTRLSLEGSFTFIFV